MTATEEPALRTPRATLRLEVGHGTDRGLRRELNEDSYLASDPVFMVADGMGGHEAGEVASQLCVQTLRTSPALARGTHRATAANVQDTIRRADWRIRQATGARAGTTLSGAVLIEVSGIPYWLVANVGDSRTYRMNGSEFEQISVDHSEVRELIDQGEITPEEALVHPRRHVVTRALGTGDDAEADFWLLPVADGDRLLVCSDGLTTELRDGEIASILSEHPHAQDAVDALIDAAVRAGGRDNITVIVVDARTSTGDSGVRAPRVGGAVETLDRERTAAARSEDADGATPGGTGEGAGGATATERTGETEDDDDAQR